MNSKNPNYKLGIKVWDEVDRFDRLIRLDDLSLLEDKIVSIIDRYKNIEISKDEYLNTDMGSGIAITLDKNLGDGTFILTSEHYYKSNSDLKREIIELLGH